MRKILSVIQFYSGWFGQVRGYGLYYIPEVQLSLNYSVGLLPPLQST